MKKKKHTKISDQTVNETLYVDHLILKFASPTPNFGKIIFHLEHYMQESVQTLPY